MGGLRCGGPADIHREYCQSGFGVIKPESGARPVKTNPGFVIRRSDPCGAAAGIILPPVSLTVPAGSYDFHGLRECFPTVATFITIDREVTLTFLTIGFLRQFSDDTSVKKILDLRENAGKPPDSLAAFSELQMLERSKGRLFEEELLPALNRRLAAAGMKLIRPSSLEDQNFDTHRALLVLCRSRSEGLQNVLGFEELVPGDGLKWAGALEIQPIRGLPCRPA